MVCPYFFLLFLFLSHLPPPPPSTLFPYTTLFRSPSASHQGRPSAAPQGRPPGSVGVSSSRSSSPRHARATRDRKSTRLNSSHQIISYAVFCLKKKKQKKRIQNNINQ